MKGVLSAVGLFTLLVIAAAFATYGIYLIVEYVHQQYIVRCKDCIYKGTEYCSMYYQCECGKQYTWAEDDDYCSWGKKKVE